LYLDYSRNADEWIPNIYGSNENLEAIDFLRELNTVIHDQCPGCVVIAEESTAWPQVTRPTWTGGLGFSMKWNMGWMHDTLNYMSKDPVYRMHHHNWLTFGLVYAFTENYVLAFSHDEVVHGKKSLLYRMPGDEWQRFANLRLLYTFMFTYPGKKLLFMGNEFAQGDEWDYDGELDWNVLDYPFHQGVKALVSDLNRLYRHSTSLHCRDFEQESFEWIDCHDSTQSILSFLRRSGGEFKIIVLNLTPVPRTAYRIGVPAAGNYHEVFNSDSTYYGGTNVGNGWLAAEAVPWMGHKQSLSLTLPPLGGIILSPQAND
ncbi:MAG: alpha amylase C-terminal domain-containing protein, partial [Pseudomonadota bacterium]